ncbi:MAG: endonuclease/exonuclease/phosphatase family protein, partial [Actinomycetota bacterium]|nr:endonuclease/exonuclease/phosphatase family protein [Actinomycetota bacterium]
MVDVDRVASTIKDIDADFIALQELDRDVRRSGKVDQPGELQRLTGMWVAFWPTAAFGGGEFGLGIAAKDPLDARFELLPKTRFDRRHGVVTTRIGGITILATHLSRKTLSRATEMPRLWASCRQIKGPKVVAGDLNTAP